MSNQAACISILLQMEGGYVNNPTDPGGTTKFGITQRTLDSLQRKALPAKLPAHVFDLTEDQASVVYGAVQWADLQGDSLPKALATLLLNAAVNFGEGTAVELLQGCVHIKADGKMGPDTLAAIFSWKSGYMAGQSLAEEFAAHMGVRYARLDANEDQFELGWFRRLLRVYTLAVSS